MVRGCGPRSLHPSPARSYEQTRANLATPDWTRLHSTEKSPLPASRMTVGWEARASPMQLRCSRHPPTSTSRPGGGKGGGVDSLCAQVVAAQSDTDSNKAARSNTKEKV